MNVRNEIQIDLFYTATESSTQDVIASDRPDLKYLIQRTINVLFGLFHEGYAAAVSSSYGKDSSVTLALVLEAAKRYKESTGDVPVVRIMTSDTKMENPLLINVVRKMSSEAVNFGRLHGLDVEQYFAQPALLSRALVTTLGGRTIFSGPGTNSKCQQDLKAAPLKKMRSRLKREFKGKKIYTANGSRFLESTARSDKMHSRGERFDVLWENEKDNGELFLSPIADWEDSQVFEFMDAAAADALSFTPFSNMVALTSLYEMTGLEVCPTSSGGGVSESSCGGKLGRFGCVTCQKISSDKSMASALLVHEYLTPIFTLNNLIRSGLTVPHHRAWIGRSLDEQNRTLVSPISHSYDWCRTLLKAVLSIDADEDDWAYENASARRFPPLMDNEELIAIAYQWARYFAVPWSNAINLWNEIHDNRSSRLSVADMESIIAENKEAQVPLSQLDKKGYFKMYPKDYDQKLEPGLIDIYGELAGVYGSGNGVIDKQGRMHSPLGIEPSFTVDLGDEPDLAWFWISEIASEGNSDLFFLTRDEYIKFKPGYQSTMARMVEYMHRVHELGLGTILHDLNAIMARPEFVALDADESQTSMFDFL